MEFVEIVKNWQEKFSRVQFLPGLTSRKKTIAGVPSSLAPSLPFFPLSRSPTQVTKKKSFEKCSFWEVKRAD